MGSRHNSQKSLETRTSIALDQLNPESPEVAPSSKKSFGISFPKSKRNYILGSKDENPGPGSYSNADNLSNSGDVKSQNGFGLAKRLESTFSK